MNDIFENTETMQENEHPRFYTAESVMRGHPDKLCDLTHSVVRSMDFARLDREIQRKIATDKFDEDDLVAAILHRAELEYEFCSAGDADPATMQIRKACAEYKPTDGFPHTFYKEVVSKVILYRDTHIEFKLQNGQIV